ncbi:MAG: prolyl oligopeptidase family serine peptidase [Polyangiaceae bacterium]
MPTRITTLSSLVIAALWGCGGDTPNPGGQGGGGATVAEGGSGGSTCAPVPQGDDPCTAPLAPGTERECVFDFGGVQRRFLVYAPASYDACSPSAVVVDAHGATETAEQHAGLEPFMTWPNGLGSGWRLVADREGFVVVTPQGIGNQWNPSDVDFVVEVERMVTTIANVDPERVYLTGISNGGFLSYWTACRDLGVFKGFAPVAGGYSGSCQVTQAAPLIGFHATGDSIVPYAAGVDGAALWAEALHCNSGPSPSDSHGGSSSNGKEHCIESMGNDQWKLVACDPALPMATCQSWTDCDGGQRVTFCDVPGESQPVGGHILYFNDTQLSLAAVAWEFFQSL